MNKTKYISLTAILIAILIIMAFTPLGYLHIGVISISLLMIPVSIGAITLDYRCGAILGIVFGITSFVQCFGIDAFGSTLLNINPVFTFILCIPTRMLAGLLVGIFNKYINAKFSKLACYISALLGAVLNTILFMSALVIFFWKSEYISSLANGRNILTFIIFIVGINGIIEMISTAIVAGTISYMLKRVIN